MRQMMTATAQAVSLAPLLPSRQKERVGDDQADEDGARPRLPAFILCAREGEGSERMIVERIYWPPVDFSNAMNAAADKECTRDLMASFYEDCLRCSAKHGQSSIDWESLNAAILKRWPKGLEYIKRKAWERLNGY